VQAVAAREEGKEMLGLALSTQVAAEKGFLVATKATERRAKPEGLREDGAAVTCPG
jgi:hypothetical protein